MYWFDIVNSSAFPGYKLIIFSLKLELLKIVLNTDLLLCHNEQSFMFYVSKTKRTCFIQYRAQLVQTMLSKTKQQVPTALSFFSHFLPRHLLQQNISLYLQWQNVGCFKTSKELIFCHLRFFQGSILACGSLRFAKRWKIAHRSHSVTESYSIGSLNNERMNKLYSLYLRP